MQYVVETRFVGERRVEGAPVEIVGKETREVDGAFLFDICCGQRCISVGVVAFIRHLVLHGGICVKYLTWQWMDNAHTIPAAVRRARRAGSTWRPHCHRPGRGCSCRRGKQLFLARLMMPPTRCGYNRLSCFASAAFAVIACVGCSTAN